MSRSTAALARFAAICALVVAPSTVAAQLRCENPDTDIQIRKVSFEGNEAFPDEELELHVVSTETDRIRRYINRRVAIPVGAGIGIGIAAIGKEQKLERGALFGAIGAGLGFAVSRISGTPRCLQRGTLAGDILNLSGFYRDQGFKDVRVDTATTVDGRWVDVTFRVVEGRPVLVDSLLVVGFDTMTMGQMPNVLRSKKGSRYSPTLTQEDVDSLETQLRNSGYPEGGALREVTFPPNSDYLATVKFTINPGPRARIGKVDIVRTTIDGSSASVQEDAVRRLLQFRPGDFYNQRALFDSERRFYRAGTFLSAEVAPNVSHVGSDSLVDVKVTVVEDLTHIYSAEPGFGTLDCVRFRTAYGDRAFLGGLNHLDVSGSISKVGLANPWQGVYDLCQFLQGNRASDADVTKTEDPSSEAVNYNGTIRLSRPLPLPGGLLPSVSAYSEKRGGYLAYLRTTHIGGALTMSKFITRSIFFEASYNLEYGRTKAPETVLCFLFQACDESARAQLTDQDQRLAVLGARFSRDRRNSADSASSGSVVRLDLRTSQPVIGSDIDLLFNKAVIDAAWYRRFIGPGVVALRLRAGSVGGGSEIGGARLPPPQERLYSGGETSVRGFRQNELGPLIYVTSDSALAALAAPDDASREAALQNTEMRIIPAGGNAMYVGNLEYRMPGPFLSTLQTILFLDVGAVSTQKKFSEIAGSNQFRWTPGVAVKYFSPVGPVQINIGYNGYNRPSGPAFSDVYRDVDGRQVLTCVSGRVDPLDSTSACKSLEAIAPVSSSRFWKRLTLTVAFPPDF